MSWLNKLFCKSAPIAAPPVAEQKQGAGAVTQSALDNAAVTGASVIGLRPWTVPKPLPGVMPQGQQPMMAMDAAANGLYGANSLYSMLSEGLAFLGFPYLSELTQRAEYRRPGELLAKEMTREWIRLTSVSQDEDKSEKLKQIEDRFKELKVAEVFAKAIEHDSWFGRGQIFIDTGDTDNPEELRKPLALDKPGKLTKGSIKGLVPVEPIWTYPNRYNATDPLKADFYKPQTWFVMGKEVHTSRILTFTFRPVPDMLKPAYVFSGISLSQIGKPYVDNWLKTRQSVNDLITSFSQMVLATDMSQRMMSNGGDLLHKRLELFARHRSNRGIMAVDKNTEELTNVSAPIGSLDHLQAQAQEHMSAVFGIPLVVLLGITPTGLNASSEGDLRIYYDWIRSQQMTNLSPNLRLLLWAVQIEMFGVVDPDISFEWEPLWSMDEGELATARNTEANTDVALISAGVISPAESRQRLASQVDSPYAGLDVDDLPELDDDEETETEEE